MTVQLTPEMIEVGKRAHRAGINHLTEFFKMLASGYTVADAMNQDHYGTNVQWSQQEIYDRNVAMRDMGLAAANAENPESFARRRVAMAAQTEAEDQLGEMLANEAPPFIVKLIGEPPERSGAVSSKLTDSRWWHKYKDVPTETFTPRALWKRVAGAYAAVVAGECDGDPDTLNERWQQATKRQGSYEGRAVVESFSAVVEMASDFRLKMHVEPPAPDGGRPM